MTVDIPGMKQWELKYRAGLYSQGPTSTLMTLVALSSMCRGGLVVAVLAGPRVRSRVFSWASICNRPHVEGVVSRS